MPIIRLMIGTALLLTSIVSAAQTADTASTDETPNTAMLIQHVCFYAGKLYSIGAQAELNGQLCVCVRGEDNIPQWSSLFSLERQE